MRYHPNLWRHESDSLNGLHAIVTPENSECRVARVFRLNLHRGDRYILQQPLELSVVLIHGSCRITVDGSASCKVGPFDSFYLPGNLCAEILAEEDSFFFIGGAPWEGIGKYVFRRFNPNLPLGKIRQIHGMEPFEREVFMTLDQDTPASRLITGLTWSREGAWTSWPPHQHEKFQEEVYCYFSPDTPSFGLHFSYLKSGKMPVVHIVHSGTCIEAPAGYHPTVALPGRCNAYFWILAAHSHDSRSYGLAEADPYYKIRSITE